MLFLGSILAGLPSPVQAETYPHIPEPMVFDMMRPLGARQGELEVNALGTLPLSGDHQVLDWAPEVEYAFADGFAVEFEFPFENSSLKALKLGLQAAFGTFDDGRSAHGIQYLGVYDRDSGAYRSSAAYMLGHRFDDRWSMMSMVGLADIGTRKAAGRNAMIVNHSTFFDAADRTVLGLEINYLGGSEGHVLLMPQWHQGLWDKVNMQLGLGAEKARGDVVRPKAGLRIVREF